MRLTHVLFGKPLATNESDAERVGPLVGVPVLGLDALASAAYGPEAMLTVLLPLGAGAFRYSTTLSMLICVLLVIVYLSYRQTIAAYPGGGGAYSVAKENLGERAGLFAAAALALDYVLNVAVAIAAGVGALVSVLPDLLPYTLPLCLGLLAVLTMINLRGLRATGLAFMLPTWLFVLCLFGVLGTGLIKLWLNGAPDLTPSAATHAGAGLSAATPWLLIHAFASGCTAMTGVEAVSNAVPIFREPAVVGARRTLTLIISVLLLLLLGEAILAAGHGVTAKPPGEPGFQSLLSQLVAAVVGRGPLYYVTLASVVIVLCLSANTSFADFPRLCRILASDRYLPEPFVHRGRRLAFSHGILVLSALSALLLVIFGGITDALIPLFAIGAFLAFTMSQAGMVSHWYRRLPELGGRARLSLALNATGMLATGATALVIMAAKLTEGAWISLVIMGVTLLLFEATRRHFQFIARVTATAESLELGPTRRPLAVVPVRRWDAVALKALRLALGMSSDVICVQVLTGDRDVDDLTPRWKDLAVDPAARQGFPAPQLIVLRSEYRNLFQPLLSYLSELERAHPERQIAVIVPELIERRWYYALLHNHSAALMRALLLLRGGPQLVVVGVPWYLGEWLPERRRLLRSS